MNLLYLEATKSPPGVNVKVSRVYLLRQRLSSEVLFVWVSHYVK
jgi:hypothetical protein